MANIQHIFTGIVAPSTAPAAVGHHYVDTVAKTVYQSVGTVTSADWVQVGGYTNAEIDALLTAKAPIASPTFTGTVSGITKAMVGLGSVDNTADSAKPVSTAQAAADTAVQSFSIQRANHTGAQTASTISDFNTAADARVTSGIATHVGLSDPHAQYALDSDLTAKANITYVDSQDATTLLSANNQSIINALIFG